MRAYCVNCDLDLHRCAGCGDTVPCGTIACQDCEDELVRYEAAFNDDQLGRLDSDYDMTGN